MAFDMGSIVSSRRDRPLRVLVLGQHKTGKSSFACSAPDPIAIQIKGEEGLDAFDVKTFPVIEKYQSLIEAITALYKEPHDFKTLILDSFSTLEHVIWDYTCMINGGVDGIEKVLGGYGKGFTEALTHWRKIASGFDALRNERGMNIVMIGHVKVKSFHDPLMESYDRYTFDIHDKAAELLSRWADGILFTNRKTVLKKEDVGFNKTRKTAIDSEEGKPFLYTQARSAHPGGGRGAWGQLPYELPFDMNNGWDVLSRALMQANEKEERNG